jgi:hypothetical protein
MCVLSELGRSVVDGVFVDIDSVLAVGRLPAFSWQLFEIQWQVVAEWHVLIAGSPFLKTSTGQHMTLPHTGSLATSVVCGC